MVNTVGILPALGEQAVIGEYEVKILRRFEGREGVGFDATLVRNGKTVADVSQRGDGGGTWARFTDKQERADFDAYVALYTWTWGAEFGEAFTYEEENVLDLLAMEAIELKRMNTSKKTFVKRDGHMYAYAYNVQKGDMVLPDGFVKVLKQGDQFWNKEQWVAV